ncbi:phage tail protein [Streptomyces sp. DSM 41524]|uniref:Phage tail protein n=4 Tax=Streptomyces violaceusniger group TaxID=2839105 RepID=A0ABN1QW54_9ACTN|nr:MULTISPECIES: phage tail protein [Streptomyces]MEE4590325.1 phage tail protein [Streptomyces sp. DSM 41524]EXU65188.1 tail protein [Streptomyces sp. PRh5]MBA6441164.1 phage tail protein [Streptomyces sp. GMR22]MBD3003908.1 phage tail protein [Streptomyces sp. 5-10]NEW70183.1 phage tail protein [Streptomyces rhizosphaericus]
MPPVTRDDPYASYNFKIFVFNVSDDGLAVSGSFTEASGLELEIPPIEYRNGSEDITVRKIPGLKKFTNLTFKRGITGHAAFWKWVADALNGTVKRTHGSIVLCDENRNDVMRWNFDRGWPTKYTGPTLSATKNEIAMETLVLAVEKLEIET